MNYLNELESTEKEISEEALAETNDPSNTPLPKEKTIFDDPVFYVSLILVGIAGFFITRKTQNNIQRSRLRDARRFRGTDYTPQNGQQSELEEELELGIGV